MRHSGEVVVSILNGLPGVIIERYTPNFNPFYLDYRVRCSDGCYRVIRERHLRKPMAGEVRQALKGGE